MKDWRILTDEEIAALPTSLDEAFKVALDARNVYALARLRLEVRIRDFVQDNREVAKAFIEFLLTSMGPMFTPEDLEDFGLTESECAALAKTVEPEPEAEPPPVRDLRRMPYEEYLQTPEWKHKRMAALRRAGFACQVCSSKLRLQVHHRTYENRGYERPEDLIVLCRACHEKFEIGGRAQ